GQRLAFLVRHAQQVRSRVAELSSKAYWDSFERATDYVVLFLPGEAFLYAAVEQDPGLIEDALNQRVIVASPTTLLGLLRVIEHGWRHKAIEQNAQEIRKLGATLYDRIQTAAEHFDRLGKAVSQVTSAYNKTIGSLERNVLPAARKMAELGVAAQDASVSPLEEIADDTRSLNGRSWKSLPEPSSIP
ncbi:MAG: DNA recombination protein RmuC, partial [Tepidisphaeraceae bacterium]